MSLASIYTDVADLHFFWLAIASALALLCWRASRHSMALAFWCGYLSVMLLCVAVAA